MEGQNLRWSLETSHGSNTNTRPRVLQLSKRTSTFEYLKTRTINA